MLRKTKIERNKNSVTLNLNDKSGSRIGPNYDDQNTVKVLFEDILGKAIFDMENAFLTLNEETIRQIFGIP